VKRKYKEWLFLSMLIPFILLQSGCVYLVIGGIGAVGGYVVSPDSVEGIITEHDQLAVWDAAVEIVSIMGIIEEKNENGGIIVAKVQGAKVTLTIINLSESAVKLNVKSRKTLLPKISVSQDVFVKVVNFLNE